MKVIKVIKNFNFYEFGETFDARSNCVSNLGLYALSLRLKMKYHNVQ